MKKMTLASLGSGFRTLDHTPLPNSALQPPDPKSIITSSPTTSISIDIIETQASFYQSLGLEIGAEAKVEGKNLFDVSLAERANFAKQIILDSKYLYFTVKKRVEYSKALTSCALKNDDQRLIKDMREENPSSNKGVTIIEIPSDKNNNQQNTSSKNNNSSVPIENSPSPSQGNGKKKEITVNANNKSDSADSFYSKYGDRFISEIVYGCEAIFVLKIMAKSAQFGKKIHSDLESSMKGNIPKVNLQVQGKVEVSNENTRQDYEENYVGGCWVHAMGVPGTQSYMPNTQNLPELLQSITKFFTFLEKSNTSADVPLLYKILPYSAAIHSPEDPQLNDKFLTYENQVFRMRVLYRKIQSLHSALNLCIERYEVVWQKMNRELEKYKTDPLYNTVLNNRMKLQTVYEKYGTIKNQMAVQTLSPAKVNEFKGKIAKLTTKLENLIKGLPEYLNYTHLKKVHFSPSEKENKSFYLNSKAKVFFWQAKRSTNPEKDPSPFNYRVNHDYKSMHALKKSGLFKNLSDNYRAILELGTELPSLYDSMSSTGEYKTIPSESDVSLPLLLSSLEENKFPFDVDIYEVPEESSNLKPS